MTTMFLFNRMLAPHIDGTMMKLPEDFDNYNPEEFPHFHVFLLLHIATPINPAELKENADIIARISNEDIKEVTLEQLVEKGLWIENNSVLV
jgi:hypothetical protein